MATVTVVTPCSAPCSTPPRIADRPARGATHDGRVRLRSRRGRQLPPSFAKPARPAFVPVVRGEGALLWTADGTELIDAMASLWYCNIGHGRGEIADAVAAQMRTLEAYSCFEPFSNPPADELASRLAELSPIPSSRVHSSVGPGLRGGRHVDQARPSRPGPGRPAAAARSSSAANAATTARTSAAPVPRASNRTGRVGDCSFPTSSRCPRRRRGAVGADGGARRGDRRRARRAGPGRRWRVPSTKYPAEARALCDRHGALLVFDEVITGLGASARGSPPRRSTWCPT